MVTRMKRRTRKASLLAIVVSLLAFSVALAASGDLDTTFSGDGRVTTDFSGRQDIAFAVAIQANGKIVIAGHSDGPTGDADFAIIRYNQNGSLDTTFSGDGKVITDFGGLAIANSVAVQPDGKIISAGYTCNATCDVALARYKPGGTLDLTFSEDGKQTTDFSNGDNYSFGDIVIQSDGKIVVAGSMSNGTNDDFAVYRYNVDGSLDSAFSGDGLVRFGFGINRQDTATALAYQSSDGKLVVSGYSGDLNGQNNNFAIARLNPNGTLDKTFSGDGKQMTDFGGDDVAFGFTGLPDGRMVVVGEKFTTKSFFAIARYKPNGTLDTTFNGTGKKAFSIIPGESSTAWDARFQPDGKLIVLGETGDSGNLSNFALVRLRPKGAFDTTFSGDGKVIIDFGGRDVGFALARQRSDGKYVVVGYTLTGALSDSFDFALARLLP